MELKDTYELMTSPDFKERFKAEVYQLENRINGLTRMLIKYKNGTLEFTPKCSYELLDEKRVAMINYLEILEKRAVIEGIDIHPSIIYIEE